MTSTTLKLGVLVGFGIVALTSAAGQGFAEGANVERAPDAHAGADAALQQFTSGGHVLGFGAGRYHVSNGTYALTIELVGAAPVMPAGEAAGSASGGGAAPLGRVTYGGLWGGISLEFDAPEVGIVRSTWRLEPGAEPQAIRLRYNRPARLNRDGTLTVEAGERGVLSESAPVAWQEVNGERRPVAVAFAMAGGELGFVLGPYDRALPLVIDPTLQWNTFLGGSGDDSGDGIAVDGSGNVYVSGTSSATWGSPVRAYTAGLDAFAAKLGADGALLWSTFLGGSGEDRGNGITVDGSGSVYLGGQSGATWGSPVRPYTASLGDAFTAKLDADGALLWNTFLGGSAFDVGLGIAVDGSGNVYLSGLSSATWGSPVRAFTASFGDAFAARLDANGALLWNTFLGGSGNDFGLDIAVDGSGNVYVSGGSTATWGSPVRPYTASLSDAFVARLDADGALLWTTFLGGSGIDSGSGIAADASGNVYVAGSSSATWGSPVRPYTASSSDGFAAQLDADGALLWNTFLGGSGDDFGLGIALGGSGNVYVGGESGATWGSPVRPFTASFSDVFAAQLDASGALLWNTFLGGSGEDRAGGIAVDGPENVYVTGFSTATWGSPVRAFTGGSDAFVAQLGEISLLEIPTLGGAGLALLVLLLAATAGITLRRWPA